MWKSRLVGLVFAVLGGAVLGFLWQQMLDSSAQSLFAYKIGIPAVVLLAALGMVCFVFGVHLLVAPRSAAKRWRLGRRPGLGG